jgi:hypothetical protein
MIWDSVGLQNKGSTWQPVFSCGQLQRIRRVGRVPLYATYRGSMSKPLSAWRQWVEMHGPTLTPLVGVVGCGLIALLPRAENWLMEHCLTL